jgi:hypothetical protein
MRLQTKLADELAGIIIRAANPAGGWGYYPGKLSRIEPTCWAILAVPAGAAGAADIHSQYLIRSQLSAGLPADSPDLPANVSWSAFGFLTLSTLPDSSDGNTCRTRILEALVNTFGVQLRSTPVMRQDNQLRGWPWTPDTFSWVEPTSWCLLALKRAFRSPGTHNTNAVIRARITEGEAVLIDRVCDSGGWNFGNAKVFGNSLPAHIPTTALGLIALQDRRDAPAVQRSLAFIEEHWKSELSGTALALSLMCFRIYGRRTEEVETALVRQWERTRFLGNMATTALALGALDPNSRAIGTMILQP